LGSSGGLGARKGFHSPSGCEATEKEQMTFCRLGK
jgi:hypothetical protein